MALIDKSATELKRSANAMSRLHKIWSDADVKWGLMERLEKAIEEIDSLRMDIGEELDD